MVSSVCILSNATFSCGERAAGSHGGGGASAPAAATDGAVGGPPCCGASVPLPCKSSGTPGIRCCKSMASEPNEAEELEPSDWRQSVLSKNPELNRLHATLVREGVLSDGDFWECLVS